MEYIVGIVFGCILLDAAIGYLGYRRNYNNDLKNEIRSSASGQSIIATKLDYIRKGVDNDAVMIIVQAVYTIGIALGLLNNTTNEGVYNPFSKKKDDSSK